MPAEPASLLICCLPFVAGCTPPPLQLRLRCSMLLPQQQQVLPLACKPICAQQLLRLRQHMLLLLLQVSLLLSCSTTTRTDSTVTT
jgi:hypothetical protein